MSGTVVTSSIDVEYWNKRRERESKISEERWRLIIKLYKCLMCRQSTSESFSLHTSIRNLSSSFYKLEKGRFISRPNFLSCLQNHKCNTSHSFANDLYSVFDVLGRDAFDWRVFLFMLNVVIKPNLDSKDDLKLAFCFFIGRLLDIDAPYSDSIRLQNLRVVIEPLVRPDRMVELLEDFDNAWSTVSLSMNTSKLVQAVDCSKGILISYSCFELMVEQLACCRKTTVEQKLGKGLLCTIINTFEERYYPTTLLKHRRLVWTIQQSVLALTTRAKYDSFIHWRQIAFRRRNMRDIFKRISDQITHRMLSEAMVLITRFAMKSIALYDIQRVGRGFLGRVDAKIKLITKSLVIQIQSNVRGFVQRKRFTMLLLQRIHAAIDLQRCIRGYLGRRLTMNKLLTSIDQERIDLAHEYEMRYLNHISATAIMIQRHFRARLALKRLRESIAKKNRENEVNRKMKESQAAHTMERNIYKEQLSKHYDCIKQGWNVQKTIHDKNAEQKVKIKELHRKITYEQHQDVEKEKIEKDLQHNNFLKQKVINEWKHEKEQKCKSYEEYCIQSLRSPATSVEITFGRKIRKRIKQRTTDVLRRADLNQIEMEHTDAWKIAEKEIIFIMGQEEGERLHKEMTKELNNLETKQAQEAAENKKQQRDKTMKDAKLIICFAIRRWCARKVMQSKALDVYEKIFDVTHQAFYYRNKKTGEVSWRKPRSLGKLDVKPKDEWKLLKNDQGLTYYYNPLQMEMSWNPPSSFESGDISSGAMK